MATATQIHRCIIENKWVNIAGNTKRFSGNTHKLSENSHKLSVNSHKLFRKYTQAFQGYIVVGYRGTFAFGRDMSDVKVSSE